MGGGDQHQLNWLQAQVKVLVEVLEELMESEGMEGDEDEEMTTVGVEEGSPVVLDLDLDDFGSPEPESLAQFDTSSCHNWLV